MGQESGTVFRDPPLNPRRGRPFFIGSVRPASFPSLPVPHADRFLVHWAHGNPAGIGANSPLSDCRPPHGVVTGPSFGGTGSGDPLPCVGAYRIAAFRTRDRHPLLSRHLGRPGRSVPYDLAGLSLWASSSERERNAQPPCFSPRITSYNVCYTKLLRQCGTLRHKGADPRTRFRRKRGR